MSAGHLRAAARLGAFLLAAGTSLAMAQTPARFGNVDDARIANAASEPQNWLTPGGGWLEQNYSGLDQVNVDTVSRLKPAWSFDFDSVRKQESQPIVVDGVMYVTAAWSHVYALDAKTGKLLWHFDPQVPGHVGIRACCDVDNRGVAVYKGKVLLATLDGRMMALEARTGKVIWSTQTFPTNDEYTITGAPRVFHDKVVIGNAGADFGVRGFLSAYNINTGRQVWKFYLTPRDPKKGPDHAASDGVQKMMADTWAGQWYKHGGGASPWNTIVYDPKYNLVLTGTGNGSPTNPYVRSQGKGANLFTASIVALDADTGKYAWHYQENPLEAWDYDATSPIMLATLKIDGQDRDVAMHLPKSGFFYVLDRKTGKLLAADKSRPEINWADHIDLKTGLPAEVAGIRYKDAPFTIYPSSVGLHNWDQWSFSPRTGLVYVQTAIEGSAYAVAETSMTFYKDGAKNNGTAHGSAPAVGKPYLLAWDPVAKKQVWRTDLRDAGIDTPPGIGVLFTGNGTLATAGNLVFQGAGSFTGTAFAMRADTGQKVWSYPVPNDIAAGPMSYAVDGEQYVVFIGGSGGGDVLQAKAEQPGRVFVFKLDGKGSFPPDPPPANPANPTSETFTDAQIAHGKYLSVDLAYGGFCARCHGLNGRTGANNLPDLRRVPELTDKAAWKQVVLGGAFEHYGMIGWKKLLTEKDAEDIRAYVASEARKLADAEKGKGAKLGPGMTPGAE